MRVNSALIHPIRFLRCRPFLRQIVQRTAREHPSGRLTAQALQKIADTFIPIYNDHLDRLPFEQRQANLDVVNGVMADVAHLAAFLAKGRNIFLPSPELLALLDRTNLADIRLADIRMPYGAFYVGFGDGLPWSLPGPANVIDGAYVESWSDPLSKAEQVSFYITTRRSDVPTHGAAGWIIAQENSFFATLTFSEGETLEAALDHAVRSGDIELEADPERIRRLRSGAEEARKEGFAVRTPQTTGYERDAAFNSEAMPTVRHVLALLCNVLCFMTAEPEAAEAPRWPDDAPANLTAQASGRRKSEVRTANAHLLEDGFMPVRLLRVAGFSEEPSILDPAGAGVPLPAHWRRGHWRRQPFGPGRQDRRLQWIQPCLVRGDRGMPEHERIYLVDAPFDAVSRSSS